MAVTVVQRAWVGKAFSVGKFSPDDTANYNLEKARLQFEDYLAKTDLKSQVNATGDEALKERLEQAKSDAESNSTSEKYGQQKKLLEGIYQEANEFILDKRTALQKDFTSFNPALLFATSVGKACEGEDDETPKTDLQEKAKRILEHYKKATAAYDKNQFVETFVQLNSGISLYIELKQEVEEAKSRGKRETEEAQKSELEAFALFGGSNKAMQDMVGNKDLFSLVLGGGSDGTGGGEKSQNLIAMEKVFGKAVERYDKLKKSGLNPIEAAEIAFANIPRAFWPDKAIREIDLFYRVEKQIEMDEAGREADSISDALSGARETTDTVQDYATLATQSTADYIEYLLKDKLKINTTGELPKNAAEIDKLDVSADIKEQIKGQLALKDQFAEAGKALEGFGVFLKAIDVLTSTKDSLGEFEGPVQKKIAEYERNQAIFDLLVAAEKYGVNLLKEVCPALGVVSSAADMLIACVKAAQYFRMLYKIVTLEEKSKLDPESVTYLPLARMAKHERLKAAEQVMKFVESALVTAGKAAELSGIGAMGGLAIDATGKIIAQGSKIVFAGIKMSDATKAKKALLEAKGPPINREAVALVFEYSNKYATYALAILAVEDNDTWAVRYCITNGLKEAEVTDPATSIMVLRKFIMIKAEMSDEQETLGDTAIGKAASFTVEKLEQMKDFIGDKVIGRDTGNEYQAPSTMDPETGAYIPNPNYKELPKPELNRTNWQQAKVVAIETGWYDDRSGLGDQLDSYKVALDAWGKFKTDKPTYLEDKLSDQDLLPVETTYTVVRNLAAFIRALKPLANDQQQTHEAMERYLNGLLRKLDDVDDEVTESRSKMLSNAGNASTDDEISEKLKAAVDKQLKENEIRSKAFKTELAKMISDQKWETPFGPCQLANYETIICQKLEIVSSLIDGKIAKATEELKSELIEQASDSILKQQLSDSLANVFPLFYKRLLKDIAYDALCKLAIQAREVRDYSFGTQSTVPDNLKTIVALNQNCQDFWNKAVEEAVGHGMQKEGASDVAKEFKDYGSEIARYETSGIEHYKANARICLIKLKILLKEKFMPVDGDGLPFAPMVAYVNEYLKIIDRKLDELKVDDEKDTGWKPKALDVNDDFTSTWWNEIKAEAKKALMEDPPSKIGKAITTLEVAKPAYIKRISPETLKPFLKAIDALASELKKFTPQTKSKKTHPGGELLKKDMFKKLDTYQQKIFDGVSYKGLGNLAPKTIDEVSAGKWQTDKQKFIEHGLVDEPTGIGKALTQFYTAKTIYDLAEKKATKEVEKTKEARNVAGGKLIVTAKNASPLDIFGKPFQPTTDYFVAMIKIVDALINP